MNKQINESSEKRMKDYEEKAKREKKGTKDKCIEGDKKDKGRTRRSKMFVGEMEEV